MDSWISVMMGQRIKPETYHHFARVNDRELKEYMAKHRAHVAQVVNALPTHARFREAVLPARAPTPGNEMVTFLISGRISMDGVSSTP